MPIALRPCPPVGKKTITGIGCGPGGCRKVTIEIDDDPDTPRSDALAKRRQALLISRRELLALDPSVGLSPKDLCDIEFGRVEPATDAAWLELERLLDLAERTCKPSLHVRSDVTS